MSPISPQNFNYPHKPMHPEHHELEEFILRPFAAIAPYGRNKDCLHIYRSYYRNQVALCFSCARPETIQRLWERRREISDKAQALGLSEWITLCIGGEIYAPPWRVNVYASHRS